MAQTDNILFVVEEFPLSRMCLDEQPLLVVNRTFPGPNITVTKGDIVNVTVLNRGPYPITVHWHGVKQHRNPWSDGPEHITQNPIPGYGGSFTYTLVFSDEEGTLWWHAHSDWSRASVHGAIVVLPPNEIYPFDSQPDHNQTIILGSWFKQRNLTQEYLDSLISGGDVDPVDSFTINGYPGELEASCGDMYTLVVDSGKTYHLRIINAVMDEEMFFAISGHSFSVVGLDGAYLTPIPTNHIMITPGQTMDILLTTNQTSRSYYMGANAFHDAMGPPVNSVTRAILQYSDYTGTEDPLDQLVGQLLPAEANNRTYADDFTNRIRGLTNNPDYPITVPTVINKNFLITISVNSVACIFQPSNCTGPNYTDATGATSGGMHSASLNNQRFVTKQTNILQAYRCNIEGVYTEDFPSTPPQPFDYNANDTGDNEAVPTVGTKAMTVDYGDAVEIVFQGTNVGNAENHPMHIHGYNFYLVANGSGNFNPLSVDYIVDPAQANTFGVPKNGWLAVRFRANNPGVWFLHCHLERHATWGMAGVLIVKNTTTDVDQTLMDPPADYPPCPLLN